MYFRKKLSRGLFFESFTFSSQLRVLRSNTKSTYDLSSMHVFQKYYNQILPFRYQKVCTLGYNNSKITNKVTRFGFIIMLCVFVPVWILYQFSGKIQYGFLPVSFDNQKAGTPLFFSSSPLIIFNLGQKNTKFVSVSPSLFFNKKKNVSESLVMSLAVPPCDSDTFLCKPNHTHSKSYTN